MRQTSPRDFTIMQDITRYSLPILTVLLLTLFFLSLPDLRSCALTDPDKTRHRLGRADAVIMAVITLLYAGVAFWKLGNTSSPESFVNMENRTESIELDISGGTVTHLMVYEGVGIGSYSITYSDGSATYDIAELTQSHADVLKWHDVAINYYLTGGTIYISGTGNVWLGEVVALDVDGNVIGAVSSAPELCDEQSLCPDRQTYMNSTYFDEIYHARTAWEHLNGVYPYEITHPPLGKIIISIGIALFGMTPFGWRFSGTLFGVLMLPVIYIFAKRLFGGKAVPAACTLVLTSDFMHFVQTRIATIDTYAVFFILLMYLFMYLWCEDGKKRYLALSGLFFGIGAASKWTCIYAGAGLAVIWALHWIVRAYHRKDEERGGDLFGKFLRNCGFCVVFFVLVPAAIYYVSYYHYGAAKGLTGIGAFFTKEYAQIVLDNQSFMFTYHSGVTASHPYSSRWYQWVLDIRPILYYLDYGTDGTRQSFGAFVNPILCWAGLIALFVLGYEAVAKRDRRAAFILIGYLAQLLPWVFITRITFEYHYFACTVFLILALGYVIALMRQWNPRWRVYAVGMAVLCVAVFIMFYPALSGMRVDNAAASRLLRWLPTWPF